MPPITKVKIRNGALRLPPALRKTWRNRDVLLVPAADRLIVQLVEPDWQAYEAKLRRAGKSIRRGTIEAAVRAARGSR